jgi:hypothetical protein
MIVAVAQGTFSMRSSAGFICQPSRASPANVTARSTPVRFSTSSLCFAAGLGLEEGATYGITLTIPENDRWRDWYLKAGPFEHEPEQGAGDLGLGVPASRHLALPWFKPIARIGIKGSYYYQLGSHLSVARNSSDSLAGSGSCDSRCLPAGENRISLSSEIVARSTGEQFIYVNDAVGPPGAEDLLATMQARPASQSRGSCPQQHELLIIWRRD